MPFLLPPLPHDLATTPAHELGLPPRDILRGVRRVFGGPSRLSKPVGAMFPDPVQHLTDVLRQSISRSLRKTFRADATGDADADAAVMQLSMFTGAGDAVPRLARVAYFGLRTMLRRSDRSDLSASETVAGFDFHTSAALKVPNHREAWSKRQNKFGRGPLSKSLTASLNIYTSSIPNVRRQRAGLVDALSAAFAKKLARDAVWGE